MFLTNNGSVITNRGTMKAAIAPSRAITALFSGVPLVICWRLPAMVDRCIFLRV